MPLKDLSGKTVYELDREDFDKLFCWQCRFYETCNKDPEFTMKACQGLIDSGVWDATHRKRCD